MKFIIYIPTRGRLDRQTTWDGLPPSLREHTYLVCPGEESGEHVRRGRTHTLISPVEGIAPKRQWLFEQTKADVMFMLDDDLDFLKRKSPSSYHLKGANPGEIAKLFERCLIMSNQFPHVGVSARGGNNRFFPEREVYNTRITNFHCINLKVLRQKQYSNLHFYKKEYDKFTMEDFHFTLQVLRYGLPNALITDYAWGQQTSNADGGCSIYRTGATQRKGAELLAKLHPGFVKVVKKRTKGAWEGVAEDGVRTDVVIQWQRAFRSAGTGR